MIIAISLYLGYGLGHDILKYFVNNKNDLSVEDIKTGVEGFLSLMCVCTGVILALILFTLPNVPTGNQVIEAPATNLQKDNEKEKLNDEEVKQSVISIGYGKNKNGESVNSNPLYDTQNNVSLIDCTQGNNDQLNAKSDSDTNQEKIISSDERSVDNKGFFKQFRILMTDPVYLFIVFGVLLGSNTIGGQNVSMAVMLRTFDVPEVSSLYE